MEWVIAGTWRFAKEGVAAAAALLERGAGAVDAVEAAVRAVEDDESVESVGVGGGPNALGEMELDAAVMEGRTLSMGAVGALKGIRHPISVAVKLMAAKNAFLVGEGALRFALDKGFSVENLLTEASLGGYRQAKKENDANGSAINRGHDTVGVVVRDALGHVAAGTSTSGLFFKPEGRLGDSPLPGCGFYADDALGAAVATGLGEDLMRGVVCHHALLLAAQGVHPAEAAACALRGVVEKRRRAGFGVGELSLLVMDARGVVGAATNLPDGGGRDGFPYAWARGGTGGGADTRVEILKGRLI